MDRHARKGKPQHHRLGFAERSARDQKPQCNPPGGANLRRPWWVCTSSTHAELGTRFTALSPWCSLPSLTRRTMAALVHRRYSRRCTNPLSQVVFRTAARWWLVPCSSPSVSCFCLFVCSMNTTEHREKDTFGGRRSFGWVVDRTSHARY